MRNTILCIITLVILLFISSCQSWKHSDDSNIENLSEDKQAEIIMWKTKLKIVHKTDWLIPIYSLMIVGGIFILLNGMTKIGLSLIISAAGGCYALIMFQSFAEHPWIPLALGVVGLLAVVGLIVWSFKIEDKGFAVFRKK